MRWTTLKPLKKVMILALQPHVHKEVILLGDCQEHQFQAIVGDGKRNIHGNPAECVRLTKIQRKNTRYICKTCKVLHEGGCFTRYHIGMKCQHLW
jgi:hypothetical protein